MSLVDQGFTSGAGFLLNLLLARWLGSEAYGAFAVGFATINLLSLYHHALLLEPLSVLGPAAHGTERELPSYFLAQLKIHAVVVTALSVVLAATGGLMRAWNAQAELAATLVASALALPFLFLLWLLRRMCYVKRRPAQAAGASAVYLAILLGGLILLHRRAGLTPVSGLLLVGLASGLAALFPLRQLAILGADPLTVRWTAMARENWRYGSWLVGSMTLFAIVTQGQTYLVAAFLGLGAAGVLRAMQVPGLLMVQIVTSVSLLMLPSMAYEFGAGHIRQLQKKAVLATAVLTAMALAYAALLAVFSKSAEHALYGGKFRAEAWLIPVLALVPVFTGFALGFSMALRAAKKPHLDLLANAVAAPVALLSAVIFIRWWGMGGAAFSVVSGYAINSLVYFWSFRRWAQGTRAAKPAGAAAVSE